MIMSGSVIRLRTDVLFISLRNSGLNYGVALPLLYLVVVGIQFNPDHVKSLGHVS